MRQTRAMARLTCLAGAHAQCGAHGPSLLWLPPPVMAASASASVAPWPPRLAPLRLGSLEDVMLSFAANGGALLTDVARGDGIERGRLPWSHRTRQTTMT